MKVCLGLLGLALVLAGCSSDPEPVAAPTEVAETATVVVTPTPAEPTSEPVIVSDDELAAAALAQLAADVAAGEIPDVMAFDVLDQKVVDGDVTFTICAWAGDTVFDTVRDSLYRTTVDEAGAVSAQHVTTPLATGDCLNTELIDSAFDFIDEFDPVQAEWGRDPASFAGDERADVLLYPAAAERFTEVYQRLVDDDLYVEPPIVAGSVRNDLVAAALFRRFRFEDTTVMEIVVCRDMFSESGEYRDGVLIDDLKPEDFVGPHSPKSYELTRSGAQSWLVFGTRSLVWSDCDQVDLAEAALEWLGGQEGFEELPQ